MPRASTSLLLDIAAAGRRLVAVGERGHILYSEDGGISWVQAKVPTSVMLTRVFFISADTGWAVGHDGNILHSADGGANWTLQRDGVSDQAQINEDNVALARSSISTLEEQLATAAEGQRDDLLQSLAKARDALESAQQVMSEPVYPPPLMDVWFANEAQGWASGAFGTLLHTANGGRIWEDWSRKANNPEELHLNGVTGDANGTLYLASEWGYIFRSTSGGETWEIIETAYDGSFFGVMVNPRTQSVFAYGLRGTIYRSTDRGLTWEELDSQTRESLFGATSTPDGVLVFVGQNATVLRSDDDGDHFVALPQDSGQELNGVAYLGKGRFVATGDGGSVELASTAQVGR